MNSKSLQLIAVFAGLVFPSLAKADVQINYGSTFFEVGKTSTGSDFDSSFVFALGCFSPGFTPDTTNEASWSSNFTAAPIMGGGTVGWSSFLSSFSGIASLSDNNAPFASGSLLYVWGYNQTSVGLGSEWILLKNADWKVPTVSGNPPSPTYATGDLGTIAVIGTLNAPSSGSNTYIQTAKPVPEPSTFALLGLGLAGLLAARKRRS